VQAGRQHDLAAAVLPRPLRDDGYDVSDYEGVHPEYGTLDDFRAFVDEAHRRGLRVITELVVNHTSDQHPWFQAARRRPRARRARLLRLERRPTAIPARASSSPTPRSRTGPGTKVAGQYFWHRFFSHQPDLNFDNPPSSTRC
jgi:maltose alpha-D-glucosyltransferase/alpha-amylase